MGKIFVYITNESLRLASSVLWHALLVAGSQVLPCCDSEWAPGWLRCLQLHTGAHAGAPQPNFPLKNHFPSFWFFSSGFLPLHRCLCFYWQRKWWNIALFCSETRDCKGLSLFSLLMQHQTKAIFLFRSQSGCLCSAAQPCKLVFWAEENGVTAFSYTKAFSAVKMFHKSCLGTCLVLRNMNLVAHRCQCTEFNAWLHFYKIKDMVLNFKITVSL